MARVGAVGKLDLAGEEFRRLTATARELGATTAWSASEAAGGMQYLAMAGFKANDIIAAMPGMLDLATAGNIDLAQAADIASNILSGFGLPAERMGYLGDVMTNTFTSSNTSLAMLGDTMKYVAPVAKSLGVGVETVAAMAGKLGDVGIQGSEAGTAMRAMYARLASPPKEAAKMMQRLGVHAKDAKGNLRDMPTILAEMNAAMTKRGLGTAQRADVLSTIFGVEALAAATELMNKSSSGELQAFIEQIKEEGAAAEVARKQQETLMGQFKALGSATESLAISIGNVLAPVVRGATAILTRAASAVDTFANAHPELTKVVVGAVAGLMAFKVASIGLGYALTFVTGPLHSLRAGLALLQTMRLASAAGGLSSLTRAVPALGSVGAALSGLKAGLLALSPALLPVLALAGLGYLVYQHWGPLKSFFQGVWQGLKDEAGPALESVGKALSAWGEALAPVKSAFSSVTNFLGDLFGGPANMQASEGARTWGQAVGQTLGAAISGWVNLIDWGVYAVFSVVQGIQDAWAGVGRFFSGLGKSVTGMWDSALASLAGVPGKIETSLGQALQYLSTLDLSGAGRRLIDTFISGITSMGGAAYDAVKGVLSKIPSLFNRSDAKEGPLSNVTHQGGMLVRTLGAGIQGAGAGPLVDPLGQHLGAVAALLDPASGGAMGAATGDAAGSGAAVPAGPGAAGGAGSPGGLTIHYAPQITVQSSGQGTGQDAAGGLAQALAQDKEALARLIRELLHQERRLSYA
ncbi:phage tail tape measure protein [Megalodesulfovibrio paquesii]